MQLPQRLIGLIICIAFGAFTLNQVGTNPWLFAFSSFGESPWTIRSLVGRFMLSKVPATTEGFETEPIIISNVEELRNTTFKEILSSVRVPLLIKGATKDPDVEHLFGSNVGGMTPNVFPPCDVRESDRQRVCVNRTVNEHFEILQQQEKYTGAVPFFSDKEHFELLFDDLKNDEWIRDGIENYEIPTAMTVFMTKGQASVPKLHMHADHFISYNLMGPKQWTFIDPAFAPLFHMQWWSGGAFVATNPVPKSRVPMMTVRQEVGDVLIVPSWFLHSTSIEKDGLGVGISSHLPTGIERMIIGLLVGVTEYFK